MAFFISLSATFPFLSCADRGGQPPTGGTRVNSPTQLPTGATGANEPEDGAGERVWGIALTADGKKLYAAGSLSNNVTVIDTEKQRIRTKFQVGDGP